MRNPLDPELPNHRQVIEKQKFTLSVDRRCKQEVVKEPFLRIPRGRGQPTNSILLLSRARRVVKTPLPAPSPLSYSFFPFAHSLSLPSPLPSLSPLSLLSPPSFLLPSLTSASLQPFPPLTSTLDTPLYFTSPCPSPCLASPYPSCVLL